MNNEIVASLCFEKIVTGNITLSFKGLTGCSSLSSEDKTSHNLEYFGYCLVLNYEIHWMVFIHVYLQFKSGYNEHYLSLTSLRIPLSTTKQ